MRFFWFGDSWVAGDEVIRNKNDNGNLLPRIFPEIVSEHFRVQCVNLGECGASIDDIPYQFYSLKNEISSYDLIFFCLTAPHRYSLFDNDGKLKRIMPNEMYDKHRPHPHATKWYKYFDTPLQRNYNLDKTINLMNFWTKSKGIKSFFCNIFTIATEVSIVDDVPANQWLVPKNECLASAILPVISSENLYLDDHPLLSDEQWKKQKTAIEKYIRPNFQHPNPVGHEKIAGFIIEKLDRHFRSENHHELQV